MQNVKLQQFKLFSVSPCLVNVFGQHFFRKVALKSVATVSATDLAGGSRAMLSHPCMYPMFLRLDSPHFATAMTM